MRLKKFTVRTPEDRVKLVEEQIRDSIYESEVGWLRGFMARNVLADVDDRDDMGAVHAVYDWVRAHIHYYPDPTGMDFFPTAQAIIAMQCGDCDDHTILTAAMLATVGFEVGCRVIRDEHGNFHIYTLVALPRTTTDGWLPVDTAWQGTSQAGDEFPPENTTYSQDWVFELRG